jgi:hypothetical protein
MNQCARGPRPRARNGANEDHASALFAYANERHPTPVEVMQAFAKRLELKGAFEKALEIYKETLRKFRQDRQEAEETFGRKETGEVAKAAVSNVPIVGSFLRRRGEGHRPVLGRSP